MRAFLDDRLPTALDLLRAMIEINSFTGNIEGVNRLGRLTADVFTPLGFTAEHVPSQFPGFGNHLVLTRKASKALWQRGGVTPAIAMVSHLDTVFPPEEEARNNFHWQIEGDRIFGPGTQDIKGGTVMIWLILEGLRSHAPEIFEGVTWKILLNSSEEQFSPDFGELCRRHFDAGTLCALVFEAEGREGPEDGEGLAVVARKGRASWRVTVRGRASHAGSKHPQGANAIVQMGRTVQQIAALTDYERGVTFNVGTIRGGTVLNRVPHDAVVEGEFRAFDSAAFEWGRKALLALSGPGEVRSPADGYACVVEVEILSETRPWPRNSGTDRLYQCWKAAADQLGMPLGSQERGGLSDGNLIWDIVPTIDGLGPWGDNDHCSERSPDGSKLPEYVEISSFVPKALMNTVAIERLARESLPS